VHNPDFTDLQKCLRFREEPGAKALLSGCSELGGIRTIPDFVRGDDADEPVNWVVAGESVLSDEMSCDVR
jgi:hypothetical protein